MSIERTFAIIKPDAIGRHLQGEILARIHKSGFKIIAIKTMRLTKAEAGGFYRKTPNAKAAAGGGRLDLDVPAFLRKQGSGGGTE